MNIKVKSFTKYGIAINIFHSYFTPFLKRVPP